MAGSLGTFDANVFHELRLGGFPGGTCGRPGFSGLRTLRFLGQRAKRSLGTYPFTALRSARRNARETIFR